MNGVAESGSRITTPRRPTVWGPRADRVGGPPHTSCRRSTCGCNPARRPWRAPTSTAAIHGGGRRGGRPPSDARRFASRPASVRAATGRARAPFGRSWPPLLRARNSPPVAPCSTFAPFGRSHGAAVPPPTLAASRLGPRQSAPRLEERARPSGALVRLCFAPVAQCLTSPALHPRPSGAPDTPAAPFPASYHIGPAPRKSPIRFKARIRARHLSFGRGRCGAPAPPPAPPGRRAHPPAPSLCLSAKLARLHAGKGALPSFGAVPIF